ncbi:MAG: LysM peptidoglycan-binding domain-containing protein [Saprospiraceae bacterium]|nr:LysM peptidoglycan-binding domain-containing protein [Saprospiraceae bacterium]
MNRNIIVQPGQTLPDIAVQYCGALSAFPEIARLNGLSLTANIAAGQALVIPAVATDKRVQQYFTQGGYVPASVGVKALDEGVSYWGIEYDFIVQ